MFILYTFYEKVFIGQPDEFPVVRERGMILEPGLEHFIDISTYTATTDKTAEALDVKYRKVEVRKRYIIYSHSIIGIAIQERRVI